MLAGIFLVNATPNFLVPFLTLVSQKGGGFCSDYRFFIEGAVHGVC